MKYTGLKRAVSGITVLMMAAGICLTLNSCMYAEYEGVMQEATYISDVSSVDESLDGQFVIVSGKPEVAEGAEDTDLGIKFEYPYVYRSGYRMYYDKEKKKYYWSEVKKSDTSPHGTTQLSGEAAIGAYRISGEAVRDLFEQSDRNIAEEVDSQTDWVYQVSSAYAGNFLFSKPIENSEMTNANSRTLKVSYSARSCEGIEGTVFGMLRDGYIVPTDEYEVVFKKGIYTKEEFISKVCG